MLKLCIGEFNLNEILEQRERVQRQSISPLEMVNCSSKRITWYKARVSAFDKR